MPLVTKAECDIFPRSIDPIKRYRLSIVELDKDGNLVKDAVDAFWATRYFGKRALARAVRAMEFATTSPANLSADAAWQRRGTEG